MPIGISVIENILSIALTFLAFEASEEGGLITLLLLLIAMGNAKA